MLEYLSYCTKAMELQHFLPSFPVKMPSNPRSLLWRSVADEVERTTTLLRISAFNRMVALFILVEALGFSIVSSNKFCLWAFHKNDRFILYIALIKSDLYEILFVKLLN